MSNLDSLPAAHLAALLANALSTQTSQSSDGKVKYKRSKKGCLTCRDRKVKCDEISPVCLRCRGMNKECLWPAADEGATQQPPASKRRKTKMPSDHERADAGEAANVITGPSTRSVAPAAPHPEPWMGDANAVGTGTLYNLAGENSGPWGAHNTNQAFGDGSPFAFDPFQPQGFAYQQPLDARSGLFETIAAFDPFPLMHQYTASELGLHAPEESQSGTSSASASKGSPHQPTPPALHLDGARHPVLPQQQQQHASFAPSQPSTSQLPPASSSTALISRSSIAARRNKRNLPITSLVQGLHGHSVRPSSPYTRAPDLLSSVMPNRNLRELLAHYTKQTSKILIAMGKNKDGLSNPYLAIFCPLLLQDSGNSAASAALRCSVLATAATHQHFLHKSSPEQSRRMMEQSMLLKKQAVANMVMSLTVEGSKELVLVLLACVALTTRDVLSGDTDYKSNLDFAISHVYKNGGPRELLASSEVGNFSCRFILEQLAMHDAFACFTTGAEPALLGTGTWWTECEKTSQSDWQWESVERQFGMSRRMADVMARVSILCSRKGKLGSEAQEPETLAIQEALETKAWQLIAEMEHWAVAMRTQPRRTRVQYGDAVYVLALTVHLYCQVLEYPSMHEKVQKPVQGILELCSDCSEHPVMLVWPLIIAGCEASPHQRTWVSALFRAFSDSYCEDLACAEKILAEQWRRLDAGLPRTPWPKLATEVGLHVLLL